MKRITSLREMLRFYIFGVRLRDSLGSYITQYLIYNCDIGSFQFLDDGKLLFFVSTISYSGFLDYRTGSGSM